MTGGALTHDERVAAGLARAPLAPAVVVTVYPSGSMASTLAGSRPVIERLMRVAAPGDLAVCVHDPINGDERALTSLSGTPGLIADQLTRDDGQDRGIRYLALATLTGTYELPESASTGVAAIRVQACRYDPVTSPTTLRARGLSAAMAVGTYATKVTL